MTDTFPRLKFERTVHDDSHHVAADSLLFIQEAIDMMTKGMYQSSYESEIIAKLEEAKAALCTPEWRDKYDIHALADECYPQVGFGSEGDLTVNEKQAASIFRTWKRGHNNMSWRDFAKSVQPTFGMNGAVTVSWEGMWLAIETDGYTHS